MHTTDTPTVLTAEAIAALPVSPVTGSPGVGNRGLWTDGAAVAGMLVVEPDTDMGAHAHGEYHHHVWVVKGRAEIMGRLLGPGSYVHIPAGTDHDLITPADEGCTIFYLYDPPRG